MTHMQLDAGAGWQAGRVPKCSNAEIRTALTSTARDLGPPGREPEYGFGLVQAQAALDYLGKWGCKGRPGAPPPAGKKAAVGRR
jgi:hypothetical protein